MRAEAPLAVLALVLLGAGEPRAPAQRPTARVEALETPVWEQLNAAAPIASRFFYDTTARKIFGWAFDDLWSWDGTQWTRVGTFPFPSSAPHGFPVYDAKRRREVEVDNYGGTWEWDGAAWTQGSAAPQLDAYALVYDSVHATVLLFGMGQTWTYDGAWTRLSPPVSPPVGAPGGFVFDTRRGRAVAFGVTGCAAPCVANDVWEWDGTTWTDRSPAARPPARVAASVVYDAARGKVVVFGGETFVPQGVLDDTWEWDGTAWTQEKPAASPAARANASFVYDPDARRALLVGDDLWAYWSLAGACTADDACDTGHCDHGVCCAVTCGPCERCDEDGKSCAVIRGADDPAACTGDRTCDPEGDCRSKGGQACGHASDCASGQCASGVCCDSGCAPYACTADGRCRSACERADDCAAGAVCVAGACRSPTARCDDEHTSVASSGAREECAPYACRPPEGACLTSCATSDDCAPGFSCNAAGACVAAPPAKLGACGAAPGPPDAWPLALLLLALRRRRISGPASRCSR